MINLLQWHQTRELEFCPKHFIKVKTPINDERYFWIQEKLVGRFCLIKGEPDRSTLFFDSVYPSFEDPQEAVLYELTFS